jgi:hypothetical protein
MRVSGSSRLSPLLPGQAVGRVMRADRTCARELCVEKPRVVHPNELLEWTVDEWSDGFTIEPCVEGALLRADSPGFCLSDFGMDRPPTRWCDSPAACSESWDLFLPDSSCIIGATARIQTPPGACGSQSARLRADAAVAEGGCAIPLMLLVSKWDRRLPSVISACARASGCSIYCRIVHLDGSGVFSCFSASDECDANMFDVNATGSGPATCFEQATPGSKAIEIFGFFDSSRPFDLEVSGICPPGISCLKHRAQRTCLHSNTDHMLSILKSSMDFDLRRGSPSSWRGISIPYHIFSKILSATHITASWEKKHPSEPGDDFIILSTKGTPPIRVSRREQRLDVIDIEFGKTLGVQPNRMRIQSRGSSSTTNKNINIDALYRPCVLSFTDHDKTSHGISVIPPSFSIALHSHQPIPCKSILPKACSIRKFSPESSSWDPEPSITLPLLKEPDLRRKTLHDTLWSAFSIHISDAPVDAMLTVNKSSGFHTEAFLPIDISPYDDDPHQDKKRRRLDEPLPTSQ